MKKIFTYIFFIMTVTNAGAESLFDISWNFGNIELGMNFSGDDNDNIELCASLLNFVFEQKDTRIGFEFTPVKYWDFYEFQDEVETKNNGERLSFINVNTYWDLIENKNILFGPFASMNYFFINTLNGINMNEFVFSGGLQFSLKLEHIIKLNNYNNQMLSIETGYRNIFGNHKFYFSVNIDLILTMMAIGYVVTGYSALDINSKDFSQRSQRGIGSRCPKTMRGTSQ